MASHAHAHGHDHEESVFDHRHDYFDVGHPDAEGAAARQSRVAYRLFGTLLGGALVANAYLCDWLLPESEGVGDLSAVVGALLLAAPLLWHSIRDLSEGQLRMDELAALGILAAISLAEYRTAGVVAFLLLMSMLIQQRSALGARAAIEGLLRITPKTAQLVEADGAERTIEATALHPGQRIRVRPGDNIAADGRIASGQTTINEATITGESVPVDKQAGDQVFAGTSNLTGAIDIEVTRLAGGRGRPVPRPRPAHVCHRGGRLLAPRGPLAHLGRPARARGAARPGRGAARRAGGRGRECLS